MPAIAPEWTRRALLLGAAAGLLRGADPAEEVWEVVTGLAAALGRGSEVEFLALCDPEMPNYSTLRSSIAALTGAYDVESAVEPVRNEGDERSRQVEVDWEMRLVDRSGLERITQRKQTLKCRIEKRGRKWKVVGLDPVAFFAPPSLGSNFANQGRARGLLL